MKGKLKQVSLKEILEKQAVQQAEKEETERLRYFKLNVRSNFFKFSLFSHFVFFFRAKAFKDRGLSYTAEAAYDDTY